MSQSNLFIKNSQPNSFSKWQIKLFLALSAIVIVFGVALYTQILTKEILEREQQLLEFNAEIYEFYIDSDNTETTIYIIENFLPLINEAISFPFIITDSQDQPIEPYEDWTLNVEIPKTNDSEIKKEFIFDLLESMKSNYEPIVITDGDGNVIQKIYYTHSSLVDKLRIFPFISILIVGLFVAIGYFLFSSIRRSEESRVWVGMAKEAAHQLGTPLSSLMAWMEILKTTEDEPEFLKSTVSEMENDVKRLNSIATRFSKIGSTPEKVDTDLHQLLEKACKYFDTRLPNLGKKVEIVRDFEGEINTKLNIDLFTWVIENLLKNAAEAIDSKKGQVFIYTKIENNKIIIVVKDTGKGMPSKLKKQIFYPGFTTKKRGWGLGLSLTKRIVEEYHSGKIYVKESQIGKGTTFQIELPLIKN